MALTMLLIVIMLFAVWDSAEGFVPSEGDLFRVLRIGATMRGVNVSIHESSSDPKKVLGGFAYVEEIENPGSRSAGIRGLLTFNGLRLRGYDGRQIRTPIGSFHYVESQLLWEPQGWFPMADMPVEASDVMIDSAALTSGHYKGGVRIGTPGDWCYDPGLDTWYDPKLLVLEPSVPHY